MQYHCLLRFVLQSPCYRIAKSYRKTLNILRCSGDEGSKSAAGDEGDIEAGAPAAPAAPAAASEQSNEMQVWHTASRRFALPLSAAHCSDVLKMQRHLPAPSLLRLSVHPINCG